MNDYIQRRNKIFIIIINYINFDNEYKFNIRNEKLDKIN